MSFPLSAFPPGHGTVCKMGNCKTNIFFHCPSQPHGSSGRPELKAKPLYFSTPTASIQQSQVSTLIKEAKLRGPRERPVLSSPGQITEARLPTHCLYPPEDTAVPASQSGPHPKNTDPSHSHLSYRMNVYRHVFPATVVSKGLCVPDCEVGPLLTKSTSAGHLLTPILSPRF